MDKHRIAERFPWALDLSKDDQQALTEELAQIDRTAPAEERSQRVVEALRSWRETAEVVAAGLGRDPVDWFEESLRELRPAEIEQQNAERALRLADEVVEQYADTIRRLEDD